MSGIYKDGEWYGKGSPEMPAEDMSEVASPMPGVMSRRFKYSTEEQIVGEWIDGKPLYQKTIVDTMPAVTTQGIDVFKYISIGASIDIVVDFKFITRTASTYAFTSKNVVNGIDFNAKTQIGIRVFVTNENRPTVSEKNSVLIQSSNTAYNNNPVYVTVQYTKITD